MNGEFQRNAGIPLDLEWVESARVNLPATERRAATHKARRSIKKRMAGRMAAASGDVHRLDHSGR